MLAKTIHSVILGEDQIVLPGSIFDFTEAQFDELLALGAIREIAQVPEIEDQLPLDFDD